MANDRQAPGRENGSGPTRPERAAPRPALMRLAMNVLLALGSVAATLAGLELAIRLYHGRLFELSPLVGAPVDRAATPGARYDPQLGWVPAVGVFTHSPRFTWSTNEASVRNNGPPLPPAPGRPIVTVGDSFTFGDEVMDHETWPAQLEQRLGRRVVNGGVLGYGIDQAFLRGAQFIATYEPDVILLAFISDDVTRAEYSYLSGAKPYFDYVDGVLTLRNVPVPSGVVAMPSSTRLRAAMGYSFLCNAIFRRVATRWRPGTPRLR